MNYKITALSLQKRNRQRINVYLDGEFAFGLARIVAAWLQVGQEISDEKIAQLKESDAREVAFQQAVKFISYRERTEAEVRKNLNKHDVPEGDIEHVLERLKRNGLVDDNRFAQAWIENRSEMRPRGQRALAYELRQHGVDQQVIEQVLEDINEEELAYQAARKRVRRLRDLEWQDFQQKMYRYLAQRGFNYEVSAPVITRIWKEINEAEHKTEEEEEIIP